MIIDGKAIAATILERVSKGVRELKFQPILCDVLVGYDPVSLSFVRIKQRTAESVGFKFRLVQLPEESSNEEVIAAIQSTQLDPRLCGLIVQLPLPAHLDVRSILSAIDESVDADGINPFTAKKFYTNQSSITPPTAGAIMHILDFLAESSSESLPESLKDKKYVVVGQGELVGKPTTHLLKQRGFDVSIADKSTQDLKALVRTGEVVITGVGKPGLITSDMIQQDAIVIDAGTSESGGSITGDVDFDSVEGKARFITPVPGGVGPVTVAKLMENVLDVAKQK